MKISILLLLYIFYSNIFGQIKSTTEISNITNLNSNLQYDIQNMLDMWNINKNRVQTYSCLRSVGCKVCIIEAGNIPIYDYNAIIFVEGKNCFNILKKGIVDSLVIVKRVLNIDKTINKLYKTKSDLSVKDPLISIVTIINTGYEKSHVFILF